MAARRGWWLAGGSMAGPARAGWRRGGEQMVRTWVGEEQAQPDLEGGDGEDDGNSYLAGARERARLARGGEALGAGNLRRGQFCRGGKLGSGQLRGGR